MAKTPLPSPEYLRKILRYDPESGLLQWLPRAVEMFVPGKHSAEHIARKWNSRHAGQPAFASLGKRGYFTSNLAGRVLTAHRVIWALQTGEWPAEQIDHVNGDKLDNRWANLRQVPNRLNSRNRVMNPRNKSGYTGVQWRDDMQKWNVHITVDGTNRYLGSFARIEDALTARRAANVAHGFTERHGKA